MTQHEQKTGIDILNGFNDACNRHDVDAMMAMMTADCVFDNTFPTPDGSLYRGQENVRRFWEEFFAGSPRAHFEIEEIFVHEDRAAQRWVYTWVDAQGVSGHVRGADLFRFRDG